MGEWMGWEGPDWNDTSVAAEDLLEVGEPAPGEEVPDYSVDEEWMRMWRDWKVLNLGPSEYRLVNEPDVG